IDHPSGVDVVRGDLSAPGTLDACLNEVDAVFLFWPGLTADLTPGAHKIAGDYAASAVSSTCKSGYQRQKVEANSLLSVLTRVCNSKGAPRLVHCIDCFF